MILGLLLLLAPWVNASVGDSSEALLSEAIQAGNIEQVKQLVSRVDLQTFDAVTPLFVRDGQANEAVTLTLLRAGLNPGTTGVHPYDLQNGKGVGPQSVLRCKMNLLHSAIVAKQPAIVTEVLRRAPHLRTTRVGYGIVDREEHALPYCGTDAKTLVLRVADDETSRAFFRNSSREYLDGALIDALLNSEAWDEPGSQIPESQVELLLSIGADPRTKVERKLTVMGSFGRKLISWHSPITSVIAAVAARRSVELVHKLADLGVDLNHDVIQHLYPKTMERVTALSLSLAPSICNFAYAQVLLGHGVDESLLRPSQLDASCFFRSGNRNYAALEYVLKHGANPTYALNGESVLYIARYQFDELQVLGTQDPLVRPYFELLKKYGLDLNAHVYTPTPRSKKYPASILHDLALRLGMGDGGTSPYADKNNLVFARMFIEMGADPAQVEETGATPLDIFRSTRKANRTGAKWFCDVEPAERVLAAGSEKKFVERRTRERCGRGL